MRRGAVLQGRRPYPLLPLLPLVLLTLPLLASPGTPTDDLHRFAHLEADLAAVRVPKRAFSDAQRFVVVVGPLLGRDGVAAAPLAGAAAGLTDPLAALDACAGLDGGAGGHCFCSGALQDIVERAFSLPENITRGGMARAVRQVREARLEATTRPWLAVRDQVARGSLFGRGEQAEPGGVVLLNTHACAGPGGLAFQMGPASSCPPSQLEARPCPKRLPNRFPPLGPTYDIQSRQAGQGAAGGARAGASRSLNPLAHLDLVQLVGFLDDLDLDVRVVLVPFQAPVPSGRREPTARQHHNLRTLLHLQLWLAAELDLLDPRFVHCAAGSADSLLRALNVTKLSGFVAGLGEGGAGVGGDAGAASGRGEEEGQAALMREALAIQRHVLTQHCGPDGR